MKILAKNCKTVFALSICEHPIDAGHFDCFEYAHQGFLKFFNNLTIKTIGLT